MTGSEILINGPKAKPHGYFAIADKISQAWNGQRQISIGEKFDMALMPVIDGVTGYSAATLAEKYLGHRTPKNNPPVGDTSMAKMNGNRLPYV